MQLNGRHLKYNISISNYPTTQLLSNLIQKYVKNDNIIIQTAFVTSLSVSPKSKSPPFPWLYFRHIVDRDSGYSITYRHRSLGCGFATY